MRLLYLTEPGSRLKKDGNRLVVVKDKTAVIRSIGLEQIDGIVLIGHCNLDSGLAVELLEREIPVTWLSSTGRFFGRLEPTTGYNVVRQLQQYSSHCNEQFSLEFARLCVLAKIRNSRTVLRRYNRRQQLPEVEQIGDAIESLLPGLEQAQTIDEIIGHEGAASRCYFQGMASIVPDGFKFSGRTRRPPKDKFNSLLSFGYTVLLYEIFTILTSKGLNPYVGFIHRPKRGHPALASDLIEEWRAVIVDSLALSLISHHQLREEDFQDPDDTGGVYLGRAGVKTFLEKFEQKMRSHNQYLTYVDFPVTFRESLEFQAGTLVKAIEQNNPEIYRPIILR